MIWTKGISAKFLVDLLHEERKYLCLCSSGGDLDIMLAATDLMSSADWTVHATGRIMSAAVPIVACAGTRTASPNCRFMIHPGTFIVGEATVDDLTAYKTEMARYEKLYCKILGKHTHKPTSWWKEKCSKTLYFGVREARRWGVIDSIGILQEKTEPRHPKSKS